MKKESIPILELLNIDLNSEEIKKDNIYKNYQYISIENIKNRKQNDNIELDGKNLTEEEKEEYEYLLIYLAININIRENTEIISIKLDN